MNHHGLAHATYKNNKIITYYKPLSIQALAFLFGRLLLNLPFYFIVIGILLLLLTDDAKPLLSVFPFADNLPTLPLYVIVLYAFAYHFLFPVQLKKYHGAEHKVFSYNGRKHLAQLRHIEHADIVNRYCSTNNVVQFFFFFLISFPFVSGWIAVLIGWLAMIVVPRFWKWGDKQVFFPISAYLQKKITTKHPDEVHLKVAILSYMSLHAKRALTEEEVWLSYIKELENIRIAAEERKRAEEEERIVRLLIEQERSEMEMEKWRDFCVQSEAKFY